MTVADPAPRPKTGQPAPAIDLLDAEGRPWRLADQAGVIVVIFHRHIH